jgi:hypothetical protein
MDTKFNTLVEAILGDQSFKMVRYRHLDDSTFEQLTKDIARAEQILQDVKDRAESKHEDKPFNFEDMPEITEDQVEHMMEHTFPLSMEAEFISLPRIRDAFTRLHELAGEICYYRAMYNRKNRK